MRILHTGDWHLGQSFYNHDREAEHQAFLDWLLEEIGRQEADALLVAGDVFDTGNPPASSMRRFYRFLADAKRRSPSLDIVLIAGNHDSAARFEAPQPILDGLEVKVVGSGRLERSDAVDRMVVPLTGRDGEIGAYCVAIPFVRASDLPARATGDECEGDPYAAGVTALYQRCVARAQELRGDRPIAIVALGHIHLAGGAGSASERALVVGGAEALPTSLLDPCIAYAALGHLHRPQKVGGSESRRYCGSPMPLSFEEIEYVHQIVRVDLDGAGVTSVEAIRIPRHVELVRIPEKHAPLEEALAAVRAWRPERDLSAERHPYLEFRVALAGPEPGLRARLDEALEGKPLRFARISSTDGSRPSSNAGEEAAGGFGLEDLERLDPEAVFLDLHRSLYEWDPEPELLATFQELLRDSAEGEKEEGASVSAAATKPRRVTAKEARR